MDYLKLFIILGLAFGLLFGDYGGWFHVAERGWY
jgi:hypothetical protein